MNNISSTDVVRVQAQELVGGRAAEIADKFNDGHMILVLNEHGDASVAENIVNVFGYGALAKCCLFARSASGLLMDVADLPDMQLSSIDQWLDGAIARLQPSLSKDVRTMRTAYAAADGNSDAMAPRMRIVASGEGPNGLTHFTYSTEVIVMREALPASDNKVILTRSQFDIKPTLPNRRTIREFAVASTIRTGANLGFTRDHEPKSDGRIDFTIERFQEKTVGYSFTAGLSVGGSVSAAGPTLSAKQAFTFGYNRSRTDRQGISYTIKDYRLEATPIQQPDGRNGVVLRSIRDRRAPADTPMGFAQHLQQLVHWEIDASYDGLADFRVRLERLDVGGPGNQNSPISMPAILIPMNSPFITRSPTVLIQSQANTGRVLGVDPSGTRLRLVEARGAETDTAIQWEFDAESRYINRKTGMALTMDPASGALSLQRPALALTQRWEWRADRLHSQYGDRVFRLTNENGQARAARSQDLPLNDENSLLAPWGQYPGKPVTGDTVPRSGTGFRPPIPSSWASQFDAVPETERWQLIILRHGIDR